MTFYNIPTSRYWLYESTDGTLYEFGLYAEEYPDGSSHPVVGSARELSGVPARRRKEESEKVAQSQVPEEIQDSAELREKR